MMEEITRLSAALAERMRELRADPTDPPLAEADAIALVQSGARDGFTYASYSPNQAVLGAIERYATTHGVSSELRRTLEHLSVRWRGKAPNAMPRVAS